MSDKPKRRFWQISMLTLLLTTFVTAALFFLNTRDASQCYYIPGAKSWDKDEARAYSASRSNLGMLQESHRGWPFMFWKETIWVTGQDFKPVPQSITERFIPNSLFDFVPDRKLHCVADLVIFVSIITLTGALCEWLIRRREGRKR